MIEIHSDDRITIRRMPMKKHCDIRACPNPGMQFMWYLFDRDHGVKGVFCDDHAASEFWRKAWEGEIPWPEKRYTRRTTQKVVNG
jgi:hypothetical protein